MERRVTMPLGSRQLSTTLPNQPTDDHNQWSWRIELRWFNVVHNIHETISNICLLQLVVNSIWLGIQCSQTSHAGWTCMEIYWETLTSSSYYTCSTSIVVSMPEEGKMNGKLTPVILFPTTFTPNCGQGTFPFEVSTQPQLVTFAVVSCG